jgi:hypothetical protein
MQFSNEREKNVVIVDGSVVSNNIQSEALSHGGIAKSVRKIKFNG